MRVRNATSSDADAWDRYAQSNARASAYHRWAYKQALEGAYGLKTCYMLAEDSAGRITGLLPCARVPGILRSRTLCALPYCDLGHPVGDSADVEDRLVAAVLDHMQAPLQLRGTEAAETRQADDPAGYQGKVRMLLDLPASAEQLFAGFRSKHRSQIRKAGKNGLTAHVASGEGRVHEFYEVFIRNMRDLGSPTHSLAWFKALARHYGADCLIGHVNLDGRVIGGGIVLINGRKAVIPWASTLREFNHLASNMLLYWSILEAVIERGCTSFDFGRSSYGEGTYRFKRQWGATPTALDWKDLDPEGVEINPAAPSGSGRARFLAQGIWRHLPLPLTVLLGSRLRPMISL